MRVAIIGGGIAGLAAAYELELARAAGSNVGVEIAYDLFEAGPRLGGVIASSVVDGTVIERGPDSFLTEKPAALELCRELGLEGDLVASNDAERKTYILIKNRLVALPDGLMFLVPTKFLPMVMTPLFGWLTKIRMGMELLKRPSASPIADESVASLVRRHYGQQAVDRLADPMLSGIYGGEASLLSAKAVLPRFVEMEREHGSLTLGMLKGMRARRQAAELAAQMTDEDEPPAKPLFTTLRFGMQQLIDELVMRLEARRLHVGSRVTSLRQEGGGWLVVAGGVETQFDAVVMATPAWVAAELLSGVDGAMAAELGAIPYSSSVTVNLVFDGAHLDPLPDGFGFLVPATEGRAMLACTFIHRKFPGRTAPGKTVLRAFLGGARGAELLGQLDAALAALVRRELMEMLEISATPELVEVQRWPRAMAQYAVGHAERMGRVREGLKRLPGLYLAGNAYDGIGISDCIRLGRGAAREISEIARCARD